jgi:hypothetical protein
VACPIAKKVFSGSRANTDFNNARRGCLAVLSQVTHVGQCWCLVVPMFNSSESPLPASCYSAPVSAARLCVTSVAAS